LRQKDGETMDQDAKCSDCPHDSALADFHPGVCNKCQPQIGKILRYDSFDQLIRRLRRADLVEGAMQVDDERLRKAAERVGIVAGCDAAEEMADHLLASRKYAKGLEIKLALRQETDQ